MTKQLTRRGRHRRNNLKTDRNLNSGLGVVFDLEKWSNLYLNYLKAKVNDLIISALTVKSYQYTMKKLLEFSRKDYNILDNLSDLDEVFYNDFLDYLQYGSFSSKYGSDIYIANVIIDYIAYCEEYDDLSLEETYQKYLQSLKNTISDSEVNILEYCINEYMYEKKIENPISLDNKKIDECISDIKSSFGIKKLASSTMMQRKAILTAFMSFVSLHNTDKIDLTVHFKYLHKYMSRGNYTGTATRKKGFTNEGQMSFVDSVLREHYTGLVDRYVVSDKTYYCALRDSLLALIMMYGGLRSKEVLSLEFGDIKRVDDVYEINIRNGKGNKSRFSVIYAPLIEKELNELYQIKKGLLLSSTSNGKKLHYSALYSSVKKTLNNAGIDYGGLHSFRHTFASDLAKSGDVAVISELLGHKNLKTTQIYIDINSTRKTDVVLGIQRNSKRIYR